MHLRMQVEVRERAIRRVYAAQALQRRRLTESVQIKELQLRSACAPSLQGCADQGPPILPFECKTTVYRTRQAAVQLQLKARLQTPTCSETVERAERETGMKIEPPHTGRHPLAEDFELAVKGVNAEAVLRLRTDSAAQKTEIARQPRIQMRLNRLKPNGLVKESLPIIALKEIDGIAQRAVKGQTFGPTQAD